MNVIIIDDTPTAIDALKSKLEHFEDITVVATASNGKDGIEAIKTHKPDLLFLDIELPDMTGIDFLGNMQQQYSHWCKVVIYTAYNEYMLPAFRNKAFDFLTKPINDDELQTIIERFYVECNNRANPQAQNDAINSKDGKLLFYTNTMDFRLIDIRDICAFAYEHELRVWTVVAAGCEKPLRLKRNVNKETLLALNDSFVQVSQKHIININYLLEVRDNVCHFYPPFEKIDSIKVGRFFRRRLVNRYNSL